jgi:hypothetical protein
MDPGSHVGFQISTKNLLTGEERRIPFFFFDDFDEK